MSKTKTDRKTEDKCNLSFCYLFEGPNYSKVQFEGEKIANKQKYC